MTITLLFLIAFALSFIGTLPPGLITLTITQTTISEGKSAGFRNALGAIIPEFIYTYVALIGIDFLLDHADIGHYIQWASVFIFLALGLWFWFAKPPEISKVKVEANHRKFFLRGLTAGFFNFLIVPFWVVVVGWLRSNGYVIDGQPVFLGFSLAGAFGALLAFVLYIELGGMILRRFKTVAVYVNRIIGGLFLALFAYQLWELFSA
jgi:threonine/homoserine/homoserine lactone efflux protein